MLLDNRDNNSVPGRCEGPARDQEAENTQKVTQDSQTQFTGKRTQSFAFLENRLIASSLNLLLTHSKFFLIIFPVYAISAFDINHLSCLSDAFLLPPFYG